MDACVMADTSHELRARHGASRAEKMPWSMIRRIRTGGFPGRCAREILAKGDLIAQRRRQQVRIGIASVVDRRPVVDIAPLVHVETGGVGNPHRRHAGAQRKLSLLSRGQVGRIGKQDQKVGASSARAGTWFHAPRQRAQCILDSALVRKQPRHASERFGPRNSLGHFSVAGSRATSDRPVQASFALVREALIGVMIRGLHARICPRTTCDRSWH
jgi:hypothetical protein